MVGMILLMLVCAAFGTVANSFGSYLIINAFSLTNGTEAIIQFLAGMAAWLIGCTGFVCMTLIGEWIVDELKGE
jgi:hypothetical protein